MQRQQFLPSGLAVALVGAGVVLAACGGGDDNGLAPLVAEATPLPGAVIDPGDGGRYSVSIDPEVFSSDITNPYFPKQPGAQWVYRATDDDGEVEIITVTVLDERRTVMGVEAIVVHDVVTTVDGDLIEDTYDWFAQDDEGNVWYFGEDTTSYADGVADAAGAWEAGVDGALPGVVMWDTPVVSDTGYRQEFLVGEAEDMGQVIGFDQQISVPAGDFEDVVVTRDWTPLEPDVVEEKYFAPGVGFVYETKVTDDGPGDEVVLLSFDPGR